MLFFKKADIRPEDGTLNLDGRSIPYQVVRSKKRRRTISLSVKHGAGLRLLVPMRISGREINSILSRRAEWIGYQFNRLQREHASYEQELAEGATLPLFGKDCTLFFDPNAVEPYRVENQIICREEDAFEELTTYYVTEAHSYLQARLDYWANALNLNYASFSLSNARRLWGSCSGRNDIRINWRIIMAPVDVIDYLLVHELCHIPHKSHGERFWQKVQATLPDYKDRQKILRGNETAWLSRFRKAR